MTQGNALDTAAENGNLYMFNKILELGFKPNYDTLWRATGNPDIVDRINELGINN